MRRPWVLPVIVLSLWSGTLAPACLGSMGGSAHPTAVGTAPAATGAETAHHVHPPHPSDPESTAPQGSAETEGHDHDEGVECGPSTACGSGGVPTSGVRAAFVPIPPIPQAEARPSLDPASIVLSTEPPPPRLPV